MTILSRYVGSEALPQPYSTQSILVQDAAQITRWAMGSSGWMRALDEAEKAAAIWRLLEANRVTTTLEATIAATTVWASGRQPTGVPLGRSNGALRLPAALEYTHYGWLSPQAMFFPCGVCEHEDLADALAEKGSIDLDAGGWLRIAFADGVWRPGMRPTAEQESWLRHPGPTALGGY